MGETRAQERGPRRIVLSGVRTACHIVYAASWLRHQTDRGDTLELYWPEARPEEFEALLPERDLHVHPPQHHPSSLHRARSLTYLAVGAPGLRLWSRLRASMPRTPLEVVVIDEGLGTYGTWLTRRAAWAREGVTEPWLSLRSGAVAAGARLLTDDRWAGYEQDANGTWRVNPLVAGEFRRRVTRTPAGVAAPSETVVLLTQPWPELGVLDERDQHDHVEQIAAQVADCGLELRVRPHPREPHGRYREWGVVRETGSGAAELDPSIIDARAVIGGPSTALLNLAAIHGVPALRTGVPGRSDLDEAVGRVQESLLTQFTGPVVPPTLLGAALRSHGLADAG